MSPTLPLRERAAALPTLGVDPGHTGGAVLLEPSGLDVRMVTAWRRTRRKGHPYIVTQRFRASGGRWVQMDHVVSHLGAVGRVLAGVLTADGAALCCEGISLHRKAAPATAIELGRTVGLLTAPLLDRVSAVLDEPLASQWRPAILGLPGNASSDDSEKAARSLIVAQRIEARFGLLLDDGHVAEAFAIARWGWAQQRRGGR